MVGTWRWINQTHTCAFLVGSVLFSRYLLLGYDTAALNLEQVEEEADMFECIISLQYHSHPMGCYPQHRGKGLEVRTLSRGYPIGNCQDSVLNL